MSGLTYSRWCYVGRISSSITLWTVETAGNAICRRQGAVSGWREMVRVASGLDDLLSVLGMASTGLRRFAGRELRWGSSRGATHRNLT